MPLATNRAAGQVITSADINGIATSVNSNATALLSANAATALGWKVATDPAYAADPTGVTDATTALAACLAAAKADGTTAYASGVFKTSGTLAFEGPADFSRATLNYTGGGLAVSVGLANPSYTSRTTVRLPKIIAVAKTVTGWAQVAGSRGVLVRNAYNVDLTVPYINSFETGMEMSGDGAGVSYCTVMLGHLDNNKRNLRFNPTATGWTNQNVFIGGRMSHNSNEGTVVVGTRHVLIEAAASKVNNNTFVGTSLESPNTVEYHLDCAGNDNYFAFCRWENTGAGARVIWRANSVGNVIMHGFTSHTIVETKEAGSVNQLTTRARSRMAGDGAGLGFAVLALENSFTSTGAALRVMEAGAEAAAVDQTTAWAAELSAQMLKGKRAADPYERIRFDFLNGRIYVGPGTSAVTQYFGSFSAYMGFTGSSVVFTTDNTYDFGVASYRPRYVRAGTGVQTGAFATASRPAASTAGVGCRVYDTTLSKPVWSDGTVWRDATGTAV